MNLGATDRFGEYGESDCFKFNHLAEQLRRLQYGQGWLPERASRLG